MAAITSQPTSTEVSAYRPILFKVNSSASPAAHPIEKMVVEVWDIVTAAQVATFHRDPTGQSGGTNIISMFEFDASDFARSRISPFPDKTAGVFVAPGAFKKYSTDGVFRFYCKFKFLKRNTDNLLEDTGEVEQSNQVTAFNTVIQHRDPHSLSPFTNPVGRRLLIDAPTFIPIGHDDCYTLSFIADGGIDIARFQFLQSNGVTDFALLNIAPVVPPLTVTTNRMIHSVGVGGRNLAATTVADWVGGNEFHPDETILEYTVDFGSEAGGVFTSKTEAVRFVLQHACGGVRLHWLNHRGGVDSLTFDAERKTVFEAKSEAVRRPINWQNAFVPLDRQARGGAKTNIRANEFWEAESRILEPSQGEWAARALESCETYVEPEGEATFLPVVVGDGKLITDNISNIGEILSLTITPANERITHRI